MIKQFKQNIDDKLNLFHQNGKHNSSLSFPCESTGGMSLVDFMYTSLQKARFICDGKATAIVVITLITCKTAKTK